MTTVTTTVVDVDADGEETPAVAGAPIRDDILPALASRDASFARAWTAHAVSSFGDHFTLVALPIATFERTRSALAVGVVAAMEAVTVLLLGLTAGALADRLRRRRILVVTDLARAAIVGVLALAVAAGEYPVALLFAAAFLLGALRVVHDAAEAALVPILVPDDQVLHANSRINAADSAAVTAGPAVAGGLMALGGPAIALAADAATFGAASSLMRALRRIDDHDAPGVADGTATRLGDDIRTGFDALRLDVWVLRALVVLAALNVVAIAAEAQFIPYAADVLRIGPAGIGAYFALGGAVAVATSLWSGRLRVVRGDALLVGLGVFSMGFLAAGVAPSHATAALAFVCAGFGSALATTHWYALRHTRFPVALQGRVTTVTRMAIMALVPPAYVAGGWVSRQWGADVLFVLVATIGLLATAWGTVAGLGRLRVG